MAHPMTPPPTTTTLATEMHSRRTTLPAVAPLPPRGGGGRGERGKDPTVDLHHVRDPGRRRHRALPRPPQSRPPTGSRPEPRIRPPPQRPAAGRGRPGASCRKLELPRGPGGALGR